MSRGAYTCREGDRGSEGFTEEGSAGVGSGAGVIGRGSSGGVRARGGILSKSFTCPRRLRLLSGCSVFVTAVIVESNAVDHSKEISQILVSQWTCQLKSRF